MIYLELFFTFFCIGAFTFGGGYAMLPLIQNEVVGHGWMTLEEIVNFIAVSESTPGPLAVNMSTYIGRVMAGLGGAACATLGVALPSFIIILIVARFYEKFKSSRPVAGAMTGLRPAVIGLIAASLVSIGQKVFVPESGFAWPAFAVSAGIFLVTSVLGFKKAHPILLIALSAAIGIAAGYALGL